MAELIDARQVLRWTLRDVPGSASTPALLAAALEDSDWELRATAMLGVGVISSDELRPAVRRLAWRAGPPEGPTAVGAKILWQWQDAIVQGAPVHRAQPRDHETMLLYALLEPLSPTDLSAIPYRPGYRYVAPEAHWLGDCRADMKFPNPIRLVTPPTGFWISEARVGEAAFEQAAKSALEQHRGSGLAVRLPTADEWEMAARATDARLFPWGNGYDAGCPDLPSPWGVEGLMRGRGEWCIESPANPAPVLCGASSKMGLAARVLDAPREFSAGYRFVVSFDDLF